MLKKYLTLFIIIVFIYLLFPSFARANVLGTWQGELNVNANTKLPLVFHLLKEDGEYKATMDSPAQGAKGIVVDSIIIEGNTVSFAVAAIGMKYSGLFDGESTIDGTFTQGPAKLPLRLTRSALVVKQAHRPQTPKMPFNYHVEDVVFANQVATIKLAGTLTKPKGKGPFAAAILISGSGPQDRDETLFEHKPFAVIADHLTKNGIAVLRFDDRGTAQSTGDFKTATSADFATDVQAAITYLQTRTDIDATKIGLIGHSEGGMIAPMVASENKQVAFVIMMAGLGVDGIRLLTQQSYDIQLLMGQNEANLKQEMQADIQLYKKIVAGMSAQDIRQYFIEQRKVPEAQATARANQLDSHWMRFFLAFEPEKYLSKVTSPILAFNGSKDVQVAAKQNLSAIESILKTANHSDYTLETLEGLNHLFQRANTGLPAEYGEIEHTIDDSALTLMTQWIKARI